MSAGFPYAVRVSFARFLRMTDLWNRGGAPGCLGWKDCAIKHGVDFPCFSAVKYDNIIHMLNALLFQLIGFVVCFILLFYFTAKYRAALVRETDMDYPVEDLTVMTVAKPSFSSRASILNSLQNPSALEVADLKEKVKDLYYRLEELKLAQDKNNADLNRLVSRLEQRLSTFEQEYVAKLQPTLLSLIEDLENIKVSEKAEK